jgi:hypothetical protein
MTDTNRPLWKTLASAWDSLPEYMIIVERGYLATQMRLIATIIEGDFATHIVGDDPVMDVVKWLRAEANRTEAGDD